MENDLISRQKAIEAINSHFGFNTEEEYGSAVQEVINGLPSAQPENQVHLCDSCRHVYPECPSGKDDVIFGNGKGNDNICACNKYEPSAQPEIIRCKDCKFGEQDEAGRWFCRSLGCQIGNEDGSGFCADAERRTDERTD